MLKTIRFGVACVPEGSTWMVEFLAAFGNFPSWLVISNFALGMVNRDIYFLIASNLHLFVLGYYLALLSAATRVRHPIGFDHELCEATVYAFPDPIFVTTLSYFLTAIFGFIEDARLRQYMSRLTTTVIIILLFGYLSSTLISGYFDVFLLVCNTILALVVTTLYIVCYSFFVRNFRLMTSHSARKVFYAIASFLGKDCEVCNERREKLIQRRRLRTR